MSMKVDISVNFVYSVHLTKQDVDVLIKLSQRHYDGRCKLASMEGGFLAKWSRWIEVCLLTEQQPPLTEANSTELDTCLKLLEIRHYAGDSILSAAESDRSDILAKAFHGAMTLANSKFTDWRASYDTER